MAETLDERIWFDNNKNRLLKRAKAAIYFYTQQKVYKHLQKELASEVMKHCARTIMNGEGEEIAEVFKDPVVINTIAARAEMNLKYAMHAVDAGVYSVLVGEGTDYGQEMIKACLRKRDFENPPKLPVALRDAELGIVNSYIGRFKDVLEKTFPPRKIGWIPQRL